MLINLKKLKYKKTMINKYGVESLFQLPEFKNKIKETLIEKYGTDNINSLPEIREKIKQTSKEKYGIEYYTQTQEYKERCKSTCKEKYGKDNVFQVKEFQDKQKQTINKKYNCDNVFQNDDIKNKSKNTMIEKYGVTSPMHVPEIKEKAIKNGLITKYKYGTATTSIQQKYLHNLLGGELNYPIDKLSLDIAFPNEMIYIEYQGSGHNIDVKYGRLSKEEFKCKEIKRYKFLKSLGWKQIEIISSNDLLPSDEVIISKINEAKEYLKYNNHYTLNIDNEQNFKLRKILNLPQVIN